MRRRRRESRGAAVLGCRPLFHPVRRHDFAPPAPAGPPRSPASAQSPPGQLRLSGPDTREPGAQAIRGTHAAGQSLHRFHRSPGGPGTESRVAGAAPWRARLGHPRRLSLSADSRSGGLSAPPSRPAGRGQWRPDSSRGGDSAAGRGHGRQWRLSADRLQGVRLAFRWQRHRPSGPGRLRAYPGRQPGLRRRHRVTPPAGLPGDLCGHPETR